jgi:glycosyltransferase involved in cell wall biosynthesis
MSAQVAVSVVVPVFDGEQTLADCLKSLQAQNIPRSAYELIVVDDGSHDRSAELAESFGVHLIRQRNAGAAAARNSGLRAANAEWVAFTDADCVASRGWLKELLRASQTSPGDVICVAGQTVGLASQSPAARFVDLMGAFDAERHLAHPRYPFAPSGNVLYRRSALLAVGGYDPVYRSYEACDLHQRLAAQPGRCVVAPGAVVFHRHRTTWGAYWRQQRSYGAGLAQFMRARFDEIGWSIVDEFRSWWGIAALGMRACTPGRGDELLMRRGAFVKALAQRIGFVGEYWRPRGNAQ